MIVHAYYDEHPRVRREAEALVQSGRPVDVFGLRRVGDGPCDLVQGVHVTRLNVQRHQGAPLRTYLVEYLDFFLRAFWAVSIAHRRRRYALVQVHSPPDFLAFAAVALRLSGVPLLLDLHEAVPEFFRARFPYVSSPFVHALVALQERLAIAAADAVITVTDALAARLERLGVSPAKVTVILNSPALYRFDPSAYPSRPFMVDGVLRLVYAGALTPTYEVDVVLAATRCLVQSRPGLHVALDIYGRGDDRERLEEQAESLGIADRVRFHGRIPLEAVPGAIAVADVGIAPVRRNPFTEMALSQKILEYGVMGKPVVTSRLPTLERYFAPGTLWTYNPGDASDLAAAVLNLVDDPDERSARVERVRERVKELGWDREAQRYVALVERVARDARRGVLRPPATTLR
jgi:glycosyltransferase involved in cell wall biosynthesis